MINNVSIIIILVVSMMDNLSNWSVESIIKKYNSLAWYNSYY